MLSKSTYRAARAARMAPRTFTTVLLIAAACTRADAGHAQQPHVVSGTVRTVDGRPVSGATIRVSGATGAARGTTVRTQTDANGNYRVQVRPGHYDVDGFVDLQFDGETYREMWLDRTNDGCGRELSENGIVRHFVLRLSGPHKCTANLDPNQPTSYYGAMLTVAGGDALPADAVVRFTFTPLGPLADGTTGRPLTFERTGAMLQRGGGRIGETSWLYDIPLGRYRVSAAARTPNGTQQPLTLRNDAGGPAGSVVEVSFTAVRMFPYGIRTGGLRILTEPAGPGVGPGDTHQPLPPPAPARGTGLPVGRYDCTYHSQYAGPIPNGRTVVIVDANRYRAWGSSGEYFATEGTLQWHSGPLAASDVKVTFTEVGDRPVLVVVGGAAAEDPDRTNRCTLSGD